MIWPHCLRPFILGLTHRRKKLRPGNSVHHKSWSILRPDSASDEYCCQQNCNNNCYGGDIFKSIQNRRQRAYSCNSRDAHNRRVQTPAVFKPANSYQNNQHTGQDCGNQRPEICIAIRHKAKKGLGSHPRLALRIHKSQHHTIWQQFKNQSNPC